MQENNLPDGAICQFPDLSPEVVHRNIMRCFRLGNKIDRKKIDWIHVFVARNYCVALGAPRPVCYVMVQFQCEKSEAYDILTVAKASPFIPCSMGAFEEGDISFSKLKQIARVATEETDADWLKFSKTHKAGELKAEVRDALNSKRKTTTDGGLREDL